MQNALLTVFGAVIALALAITMNSFMDTFDKAVDRTRCAMNRSTVCVIDADTNPVISSVRQRFER